MNATLTPHPQARGTAATIIRVDMSRQPDGTFVVSYVLEGDVERIRIPEPREPRCADDLWRHTCFEAFLKEAGADAYREYNFSPSREWAVYCFGRYRERKPAGAAPRAPRISVRRGADTLELKADVDLDGFARGAKLQVGLAAVVEETDGTRSYWALNHPAPKPDFHHAGAFVLDLDPAAARFSRSAAGPGSP